MSIFHVFPGLFNGVDIEQARFSYTFTKSITSRKTSTFQQFSTNNCKYTGYLVNLV